MREPVPAAERLRHRMTEAEAGQRQSLAGSGGAEEQRLPRTGVAAVVEDGRQGAVDQLGRLVGHAIRFGRAGRVVERLGRVRQGVQCRARGLCPRQAPGSAAAHRRSPSAARRSRRRAFASRGRGRRRTASTRSPNTSSARTRAAIRSPPTQPSPCRSRCHHRRPRCRRLRQEPRSGGTGSRSTDLPPEDAGSPSAGWPRGTAARCRAPSERREARPGPSGRSREPGSCKGDERLGDAARRPARSSERARSPASAPAPRPSLLPGSLRPIPARSTNER